MTFFTVYFIKLIEQDFYFHRKIKVSRAVNSLYFLSESDCWSYHASNWCEHDPSPGHFHAPYKKPSWAEPVNQRAQAVWGGRSTGRISEHCHKIGKKKGPTDKDKDLMSFTPDWVQYRVSIFYIYINCCSLFKTIYFLL